ncbi:MAG: TetR/AcrR family transcriptional regulator [Tannerella sp.]|jgi:AcrR family transcriptional regulator|nr:TetR/AcrR family transcriptional regulator [Tannerella sp.]
MPRTKEQNEIIRSARKQEIMDAALQAFAEKGYANTSISEIGRQVNISKGLLYNYFESKDDLLQQILISGAEKISKGLFTEHMTTEQFLADTEELFDNVMENKNFLKLYTALSVQSSVTKQVELMTNNYTAFKALVAFFQRKFGEDANKELLLLSVIAKGYSILALFGDRQQVIPLDMLKSVVMDFIRQRYAE